MPLDGCHICSLAKSLKEEHLLRALAPGWTINRYQPLGPRPSLVLQTREHREDIPDLTAEEMHELATMLPTIIRVQKQLSGALHVHVIYRNEAAPRHVHLHLIPRYANDRMTIEAGDPLPSTGADVATAQQVSDGVLLDEITSEARIHDPDRSSPLLRKVIRVTEFLTRLSPYRLPPIARIAIPARGEIYVGICMVIMVVTLAVGSVAGWLPLVAIGAALLATVRYVDILSMHLRTVLVRRAGVLASARRSLVLLFANLVELALIQAIWVGAASRSSLPDDLLNAGGVAEAAAAAGNWVPAIATTACSVGTFVLLGMGLANILGLVASNFREVASGDPG